MKAFAVKTSIRADPERTWALPTDAPEYTRWNSTVQKVAGKIALGERVTVHPKINPGLAFPVTELYGTDGSTHRPGYCGLAAGL